MTMTAREKCAKCALFIYGVCVKKNDRRKALNCSDYHEQQQGERIAKNAPNEEHYTTKQVNVMIKLVYVYNFDMDWEKLFANTSKKRMAQLITLAVKRVKNKEVAKRKQPSVSYADYKTHIWAKYMPIKEEKVS